MKTCTYCKKEKSLEEFHNLKSSIDGKNSICKECRKLITKKSYIKNFDKEKLKKINEKRRVDKSEWYKKDKKSNLDKYREKWNIQNKKRVEAKAEWFQKNKERINKKILEERKNNPKKRICHNISKAILRMVKEKKSYKKWETLVGYTNEELINHLIKTLPVGYSLDDYKNSILHIDHIIPVDLFEFEDFDDEFKKCWNLKNLRFLEGDKNLNKKNKLDKSLIIEYNIENLLPKGVKFENL